MYNGLEQTNNYEGFLNGASVVIVVLAILGIIIAIALCFFLIVSNCKLFKKAGEAWWKAIIPLYNSWIQTKITGLAWWWFVIFCVLSALISANTQETNFVLLSALCLTSFNYNFNLAKKFGKSNGFAVLTTFLPIVGIPILAFGSAKYNASAKVDENGIFSIKK